MMAVYAVVTRHVYAAHLVRDVKSRPEPSGQERQVEGNSGKISPTAACVTAFARRRSPNRHGAYRPSRLCVISRRGAVEWWRPLYPRKLPRLSPTGASAKGQERPPALQQNW